MLVMDLQIGAVLRILKGGLEDLESHIDVSVLCVIFFFRSHLTFASSFYHYQVYLSALCTEVAYLSSPNTH